MSAVYSIGDELEVRIERIVPRGYGIAFAEKLTVLVPLAVPGDVVRVQIREVKKRLAFAEIVDVVTPGANRTQPPCIYFGTCGGCDLQQLNYEAQLAAKVGIIRDCLKRIGKIDYAGEIPIIASPPLGYRSRARWHIDSETLAIGYYRRDSHDVVDVAMCPILTPELQSTLEKVRGGMERNAVSTGLSEVEAAAGDGGEVSTYSFETDKQPAELTFSLGDDVYTYNARSFFQANRYLIDGLIDAALTGTSGEMGFDLYSGVGLFSLPMARRFKQVIAVEGNPVAADFARKNAERADLNNIKVLSQSVIDLLSADQTSEIDFVLIDPPRAGTEKHTIPAIAARRPKMISYVSCEPSILARDLPVFLSAGYEIDAITALDLFPQTHHVETVVRLRSQ